MRDALIEAILRARRLKLGEDATALVLLNDDGVLSLTLRECRAELAAVLQAQP